MDRPESLHTERLKLRRWTESDFEAMCAINADPKVMEFFPKIPTREETRAMLGRIAAHFEKHCFGIFVAEGPAGEMMGFIGLNVPDWTTPITPCVEIGWRLGSQYWGKGYATEGARAVLKYGFEQVGLHEIVAMTVPANIRSQSVMLKLGMKRDPALDFDHPRVEPGHPLRRHILFRMTRVASYKKSQ